MKTIIDNETRTSKYLVADDYNIDRRSDCIKMGNPDNPDFIIADLNENNASVVSSVTEPEDWFGCKYTCSEDGTFALVDGWVDPRDPE